jgi:hypothetical protein
MRVRVFAAGGVERIQAAMTIHIGEPEVQADSCGALARIALNQGCAMQSTHWQRDAVKLAAAAMIAYPEHASVQRMACLALGNCCLCVEARARMNTIGAIELAIKAMQTHANALDVQQAAALLMYNAGSAVTETRVAVRMLAAVKQANRTHRNRTKTDDCAITRTLKYLEQILS